MQRYENGRKVLREKSLPGQGTFAGATETMQSTNATLRKRKKSLARKKFAGPRNLRRRHGNDAIDDANRNRRSRRQQQKARRMKDGGGGREADRRTRSRTNRCNLQMATRQK